MKLGTQSATGELAAPAVPGELACSVRAYGLSLAKPLWIDLEVTPARADGGREPMSVRLSLREGTRSLLALVSWSSGLTISSAMQRIAEDCVGLLLERDRLRRESGHEAHVQSHEIQRDFVHARLETLLR